MKLLTYVSKIRDVKLKTMAIVVALEISVFTIASVVHAHYDTVRHAFALATTHQPESFTELYFVNSAHLPYYSPAGKPQTVTFRVANHQTGTKAYSYTATIKTATGTATLAGGILNVSENGSVDTKVVYTLADPNADAQITVTLNDTPYAVTFRTKS